MRPILGIQQETGDEEAGQDEEQVHAQEAEACSLHDEALGHRAGRRASDEVERHHHQDG
jgi:hypothetical protein